MAAKTRETAEAGDEKARERLEVLELAARLGNAAEACRRSGVDRTSFYQWQRRYAREGLAGLRNRPPIHRSHPQATPADVSRRVVKLALANPSHGCDRIANALARDNIDLSAVTIQKILHKAGLGTQATRAAALEERYAQGHALKVQQLKFLEAMNPCFRERATVVLGPGELIAHGIFFLGKVESAGAVYAHAIVDCYSSFVFCGLATDARIETTIATLQNDVLPFFRARHINPGRILSARLSDTSASRLQAHLFSNGLEFSHADDAPNGFVERFRQATMSEFFQRPFFRRSRQPRMISFQREFADWLQTYNNARAQHGYRNYGATPADVISGAIAPRS